MKAQSPEAALVPWTTPELTGINRLPGRATLSSFSDSVAARNGEAPNRVSLSGPWQFRLVARPEDTPYNFPGTEFQETGFVPIDVPGNWTMQGHDFPHYTNVRMPFDEAPPNVPKDNPTGLYRARFCLPDAFAGKRLVLHFGGVTGCYSGGSMAFPWASGRTRGYPLNST